MGARYLCEAPLGEAMRIACADNRPEPLAHTVWEGEFMGMCHHDIACPVCFDAPAMIVRDVTPGRWKQTVQPCRACQSDGWEVRRASRLGRLLKRVSRWF